MNTHINKSAYVMQVKCHNQSCTVNTSNKNPKTKQTQIVYDVRCTKI